MPAPKVRLYTRVVLPDGTHRFTNPVYTGKQKLKEGWAVINDQPQDFDKFTYYVRYLKNGKRVYENLGSDTQQAFAAKKRLKPHLNLTQCHWWPRSHRERGPDRSKLM